MRMPQQKYVPQKVPSDLKSLVALSLEKSCYSPTKRGACLNGSVEILSVKKSYGNLKAVDGVSFSVDEGEIFALLGPNGAGKTTLIEILEGLRKRDEGDVK